MTPANFTHLDTRTADRASQRVQTGMWMGLFGALIILLALLACLPDGVAEPVQSALAWLLVGTVATGAVAAVVKGLERLLDCEAGE